MKAQIYNYAGIIILYILYNQFFRVQDEKTNTIINILFASILFGYMAYMAIVVLKKMKKKFFIYNNSKLVNLLINKTKSVL